MTIQKITAGQLRRCGALERQCAVWVTHSTSESRRMVQAPCAYKSRRMLQAPRAQPKADASSRTSRRASETPEPRLRPQRRELCQYNADWKNKDMRAPTPAAARALSFRLHIQLGKARSGCRCSSGARFGQRAARPKAQIARTARSPSKPRAGWLRFSHSRPRAAARFPASAPAGAIDTPRFHKRRSFLKCLLDTRFYSSAARKYIVLIAEWLDASYAIPHRCVKGESE